MKEDLHSQKQVEHAKHHNAKVLATKDHHLSRNEATKHVPKDGKGSYNWGGEMGDERLREGNKRKKNNEKLRRNEK